MGGKLKSKLGKKLFYVLSLTGITAVGGWIMKKCKPKWYEAIVDKLPNFWPFSYLKDGKKGKSKKKGGKKSDADEKSSKEKSSSSDSSSGADSSPTGGARRTGSSARSPLGGGGSQMTTQDWLDMEKNDPERFDEAWEARKVPQDVVDILSNGQSGEQ